MNYATWYYFAGVFALVLAFLTSNNRPGAFAMIGIGLVAYGIFVGIVQATKGNRHD